MTLLHLIFRMTIAIISQEFYLLRLCIYIVFNPSDESGKKTLYFTALHIIDNP